ncbi:MAG: hypothetical protein QM722_21140 [Piscinibacter sp.]
MTASTNFPVSLPTGWRPAWLLLHLMVGLTLAVWVLTLWTREAGTLLGCVPVAMAGWLLTIGWRPLSAGELRWDGQAWFLKEPASNGVQECEGSLSLAIDAGGWLLLRFRRGVARRPGASSAWLLLGRGRSPHDWSALRRAVYSPRSDPAGPSAQATAHPPA